MAVLLPCFHALKWARQQHCGQHTPVRNHALQGHHADRRARTSSTCCFMAASGTWPSSSTMVTPARSALLILVLRRLSCPSRLPSRTGSTTSSFAQESAAQLCLSARTCSWVGEKRNLSVNDDAIRGYVRSAHDSLLTMSSSIQHQRGFQASFLTYSSQRFATRS